MRGRFGHAMTLRKRRREDKSAASQTPIVWTLPVDLLFEIVARSAPHAFICFAATSKLLRRDILSAPFIRRVSHQAAPCILASCNDDDKPFTLVHPATPLTASFCHDYLFPFFSRRATSLFDKYSAVTSRRGLVLLQSLRCPASITSPSGSDLCVYDPVCGAHTLLPCPLIIKISTSIQSFHHYVLLTAADGIESTFLLLVARFSPWGIELQTASSCGTWGCVTDVSNHDLPWWPVKRHCDPAILHGGVVHWLISHDKPILSYDLGRQQTGLVKLPTNNGNVDQLHLATSSDGKLLKLLSIEGFMLFVWLHLPVSPSGGSGWSLETVIDMEGKMRSLLPDILHNGPYKPIVFYELQKRSGEVVFLQVLVPGYYDIPIIVFDLETKDMHRQECGSALSEIDLQSRLRNMKIFS